MELVQELQTDQALETLQELFSMRCKFDLYEQSEDDDLEALESRAQSEQIACVLSNEARQDCENACDEDEIFSVAQQSLVDIILLVGEVLLPFDSDSYLGLRPDHFTIAVFEKPLVIQSDH